jgi:hypothetical protein
VRSETTKTATNITARRATNITAAQRQGAAVTPPTPTHTTAIVKQENFNNNKDLAFNRGFTRFQFGVCELGDGRVLGGVES